jgi:hypothetical protein
VPLPSLTGLRQVLYPVYPALKRGAIITRPSDEEDSRVHRSSVQGWRSRQLDRRMRWFPLTWHGRPGQVVFPVGPMPRRRNHGRDARATFDFSAAAPSIRA